MISHIEFDYNSTGLRNQKWRCEVFGYWLKYGIKNWGVANGRWKWLAYIKAKQNWYDSIHDREQYLKIQQKLGT